MQISEKYIEALSAVDGWATVSEWALKVASVYPELLENANEQARSQKNPTTGIREIAARLSSAVSAGRFGDQIEIDDSERPKKIRFLSREAAVNHAEKELEEDLAPITRFQRIRADEESLSVKDKYRIAEFEVVIGQLKSFFDLDFEFEHAKAILNPADPGKHHPDNIQILLKSHNRLKGSKNWERFSIDEQVEYIDAAVKLQRIVSKRMEVEIVDDVIGSIIQRIKMIY